MIKAIETQYKGYNFRSRTEARWAVFFDVIGWNWQYEAEGYHLPSGPYLPDFYFPDLEIFAEVKAGAFNTVEKLKCQELSMLKEKKYNEYHVSVLMLDGPPDLRCYESYKGGEECCQAAFVQNLRSKYAPLYYGDGVDYFPGLEPAVKAALSARFEHGQQPYIPKKAKKRVFTPSEIDTTYQQSEAKTKQLTPEQYKKMVDEVNEYNRKAGTPTNYKY